MNRESMPMNELWGGVLLSFDQGHKEAIITTFRGIDLVFPYQFKFPAVFGFQEFLYLKRIFLWKHRTGGIDHLSAFLYHLTVIHQDVLLYHHDTVDKVLVQFPFGVRIPLEDPKTGTGSVQEQTVGTAVQFFDHLVGIYDPGLDIVCPVSSGPYFQLFELAFIEIQGYELSLVLH